MRDRQLRVLHRLGIEADVCKMEREIDQLVCQPYSLTPENNRDRLPI